MENKFQDLCQKAISDAGYELLRVTWKRICGQRCFQLKGASFFHVAESNNLFMII